MHAFQLIFYVHSIILCYTFAAPKRNFIEALYLIIVIFNLFIPAVFTEQYIESMGQSQQTQLYCGRMAYVY
jgi:uncharacterized membrane protein